MNVGVNVQLQTLTMADVEDLRRFAVGALVIADWPEHVPETLAVLDAAGVGVGLWRFCTDPRTWPGWPAIFVKKCLWLLAANEPDLEGWPDWYQAVCAAWRTAGGKLVEAALSDEVRYAAVGAERYEESLVLSTERQYDAVSAHVYPLGRGAANLAAVRSRAHGRPLFITEFGIAGQQQTCLQQQAATGITEPTFIYTYRARDAQAQPQYDVAGMAFLPAVPEVPARTPAPIKEDPVTVPELDQGWTKACWAFSVAECFDGAGHYVSPFDVYAQVKGSVFAAPGQPATFDELRAAINAAAAMTHARVKWFGPLGICNDPGTFDQLVGDGWYVIAGVKEADLQPGQDYGHYVVARREEWLDGKPYVDIVDSYHAEDGGSDRYPLAQFHTAMADNWDPNVDALAFQIVAG